MLPGFFTRFCREGIDADLQRLARLIKRYGEKQVFTNVNFAIERGDRIALVGVNGAGKSTMIKLLSGVERPTAGSVQLGHNVEPDYFAQDQYKELDPETRKQVVAQNDAFARHGLRVLAMAYRPIEESETDLTAENTETGLVFVGLMAMQDPPRPEVRDGIKEYSSWPTIPQLYVDGRFVGGTDIVRELQATGELEKVLGERWREMWFERMERTPPFIEAWLEAFHEAFQRLVKEYLEK